jgi:hypothetical protein
MKIIIFVSLLLLPLFGKESNSTVKLVNDIALTSQKIANNYLMIYGQKDSFGAQRRVFELILSLEDDYRSLAKYVKSQQQKQMLEYLSYNKDEIKEILKKEPNKDNANEIQDISKTLLEGCRSFLSDKEYLNSSVGLEMLNNSYIAKALKLESDIETSSLENNLSKVFENKRSWRSYKELYEKRALFVPNLLMILSEALEANR